MQNKTERTTDPKEKDTQNFYLKYNKCTYMDIHNIYMDIYK